MPRTAADPLVGF